MKVKLLFFILPLLFSFWLMNKSFGYDSQSGFRIARHQVGDFGLHISLIRSFSWGNNFPPESPYFPGKPLPYHYFFDMTVGMLEKIGVRIDYAMNGLSAIFFALLLYLVFSISQTIFGKNIFVGILSVLFFIFCSSLSFLDFITMSDIPGKLVNKIWLLPDYLDKGPFDGSIISIYFTLNVFLNQRHLIVGLTVCLFIINCILKLVLNKARYSTNVLLLLGFFLGISSRIHTLAFISTCIIVFLLFILFKKYREILFFFLPVFIPFIFHLKDILTQHIDHPFFYPGFIVSRPFTIWKFFEFWILNLGIAMMTILLGFLVSNNKQRKIFLSVISLFVLGNLFQFSFRIEHNHTLLIFFLFLV